MSSGREKVTSQSRRDNLILLGVKLKKVNEVIDFLAVSSDATILLEELGNNHRKCDVEQFLLPVFRPLYLSDSKVRKSVQERLSNQGQVPIDMMNQYLAEFDEHPHFTSRFDYGDKLGEEAVDRFVITVREVVFDTLKSYLGLSPKPKK